MSPRLRRGDGPRAARRIVVGGRVQGVGFRPFTYRTAVSLGLCGWVRNGAGKVLVHVEGRASDLAEFEAVLQREPPPLARPRVEASNAAAFEDAADFRIIESDGADAADVSVPPDLFCCDECLAELDDPAGRRRHYPFTNCTQCGPRYTLIGALPYDRPNTAMAGFELCAACRAEYDNPRDRRFHAQPLACPACGPRLSFRGGEAEFAGEAALAAAIVALNEGQIVAIRGVGGYHLDVRAGERHGGAPAAGPQAPSAQAIGGDVPAGRRRRSRIGARERCPGRGRSARLRRSRPADRRGAAPPDVSPEPGAGAGLAQLGVFLPYSPLHHLILAAIGRPLVATSGNVSGEPVITDPRRRNDGSPRWRTVLHDDRPDSKTGRR